LVAGGSGVRPSLSPPRRNTFTCGSSAVSRRRRARELALKALYQYDLLGHSAPEAALEFCKHYGASDELSFALELVDGCIRHWRELDEMIRNVAEHWDLGRMPVIDRNILRIGACELAFRDDIPAKVAINEAIELAKRYSTQDSPMFVNGILDRLYATYVRPSDESPGGVSGQADRGSAGGRGEPDPEARVDLHVHSTASDGSVEPQELAALAAQAGLSAFALTDHDTVEGVEPARRAAQAVGIELIAGVELTGYSPTLDGKGEIEVHILGLLIDPTAPELLSELKRFQHARVDRIGKMTERLKGIGLDIEAQRVLARAGGATVGRVHVAQELVERGFCETVRDAFDRYIGAGCPAYVPKEKMTARQAVELVRAAGGCAVFAHPGVTEEAQRLIEELAGAGLAGVEVHSPAHTEQQERDFMELANRLGLAVSGGSDFHGEPKPHIQIGQEAVSFVELDIFRRAAGVSA